MRSAFSINAHELYVIGAAFVACVIFFARVVRADLANVRSEET